MSWTSLSVMVTSHFRYPLEVKHRSTYIALCNESAQSLRHIFALCNYYNWYYLGGRGRNHYKFGD